MTVFTRSLVPESPMVLMITYFKDIKFVLRCVSAGSSASATGVYGPPCLEVDPAPDSQREKLKWSVKDGTICVYLAY